MPLSSRSFAELAPEAAGSFAGDFAGNWKETMMDGLFSAASGLDILEKNTKTAKELRSAIASPGFSSIAARLNKEVFFPIQVMGTRIRLVLEEGVRP